MRSGFLFIKRLGGEQQCQVDVDMRLARGMATPHLQILTIRSAAAAPRQPCSAMPACPRPPQSGRNGLLKYQRSMTTHR